MTLLISVFAAVIFTLLWYFKDSRKERLFALPCFMFWGASIMWLVDAVFEFVELGAAYFTPEPADMLNDLFLGLSVVALALVIWVVALLVKDPKGVVKKTIVNKD